jgi:hypothetical protein
MGPPRMEIETDGGRRALAVRSFWPSKCKTLHREKGGFEGEMDTDSSVLCVGRDRLLLQSRKRILAQSFQVETTLAIAEVEGMCARHTFDVIVLCHTLTTSEREQVSELVRKNYLRPRILSLKREFEAPSNLLFDKELCIEDGPEALVNSVSALV